jgi:hypothetical protein
MCIYKDIVDDFIDSATAEYGCGCFEGVEVAVMFAQSLGGNARQKCRRYGIVPKHFFQCLHGIGLLDADQIPKCGVSIKTAKVIMETAGFRKRFTRNEYFDLKLQIQCGSQQHIWRRIMNQVRTKARKAA